MPEAVPRPGDFIQKLLTIFRRVGGSSAAGGDSDVRGTLTTRYLRMCPVGLTMYQRCRRRLG
jgi:hypothetical protein